MRRNMRLQRAQIRLRRFRQREQQGRQTARRTMDEQDQCAFGRAHPEPVMRAGVDLDHLAVPRSAFARLKHALVAHRFRFPEVHLYLYRTDRLERNGGAFAFQQRLRSQGRSKIPVFATR